MLVIGVDAANWTIIEPNINELPNFKTLMEEGTHGSVSLQIKPLSAIAWSSMFSGTTPDVHGHTSFAQNGELREREDIDVDFIWDTLSAQGYDVKALNVPFVVPPYNFNCDFEPVGYGLPTTAEEWSEELVRVTEKAKEIMETSPDLLIVCYTLLDRIQHFHWNDSMVLDWYQKLDQKLGELLPYDDKILLISDHGMCDFEEAEVQTLPRKTESGRKLKGDHSSESIYITKNLKRVPKKITDIYNVILNEFTSE